MSINVSEGWASPRHCTVDRMLLPSGNPFKYHEVVLYLQPTIPPKRLTFSPLDWGMLRRSVRILIFGDRPSKNETEKQINHNFTTVVPSITHRACPLRACQHPSREERVPLLGLRRPRQRGAACDLRGREGSLWPRCRGERARSLRDRSWRPSGAGFARMRQRC